MSNRRSPNGLDESCVTVRAQSESTFGRSVLRHNCPSPQLYTFINTKLLKTINDFFNDDSYFTVQKKRN